jgi:hypothetical protein
MKRGRAIGSQAYVAWLTLLVFEYYWVEENEAVHSALGNQPIETPSQYL